MAQGALGWVAAGGVFCDHMGFSLVLIALTLVLARPSLRRFLPLFKVLSMLISAADTYSRLNWILSRIFSICSPPFTYLLGVLLQGGTTVNSSFRACDFTALIYIGRAMMSWIVRRLWILIMRLLCGRTLLLLRRLLWWVVICLRLPLIDLVSISNAFSLLYFFYC